MELLLAGASCGLGFLNPMPNPAEIAEMYKVYFRRSDGVGYAEYPVRLVGTCLDYLLWEMIKRHAKGCSSLLDVGCAFGTRVAFFQRKGVNAVGVDMSDEAVKHGRETWNLDLHVSRYEAFEAKNTFEVITMIDFIEHLPVPADWIQKTLSLTHEGSLLLILTPDFDCYTEYGEKWIGYNTSFEHVLFYNRSSLSFLRRHGFGIVDSMNVRTQSPVPGLAGKQTSIQSLVMRLKERGLLKPPFCGYFMDLYSDMKSKLRWHDAISRDTHRQNSLLVVAKRVD